MLWNITLIQVACKQTECASFCFNLMNLIVLAFLDGHCSFSGFSCVGRSVRGNNPPKLQHKDREREREMERERPTIASSQTDTNRQLQSEDCCLFGEGKRGEEKKGRKFYLICNCQESIFTCKIVREWERLPRGRNMTAFTRVRIDHHLQPPIPPSPLSFSLHLYLPHSLCFPPSILPISPPLPFPPLILFSDSITLHFDNPAA